MSVEKQPSETMVWDFGAPIKGRVLKDYSFHMPGHKIFRQPALIILNINGQKYFRQLN